MEQTPGAKMVFFIRRRAGVSREELIAHWFKNHMPAVIESQLTQRAAGRVHAQRYLATLFDPDFDPDADADPAPSGDGGWDGAAHLWFDRAIPQPDPPHGTEPVDTFQQKAEPYTGWATTEYVVVDGDLPAEPLTLNEPFPTTRSGFFRATLLAASVDGADHDAFFDYWLDVHAPAVSARMDEVGGIRYTVSLAMDPGAGPYAGMAELTFPDEAAWRRYLELRTPDDLAQWIDTDRSSVLTSRTDLIGIP